MGCTCDGPGYCLRRGYIVDQHAVTRCKGHGPVLVPLAPACVYLRARTQETVAGRPVYECKQHDKCVLDGNGDGIVSCEVCPNKLYKDDGGFADKFEDTLHVTDRHRTPTKSLHNILAGGSAVLACGGPSANELRLEALNERGCFTLAVNNMGGHDRFKPQAFTCTDPPSKFHNGIWQDPSIMKFVPSPKLARKKGRLRRKTDGEFQQIVDEHDSRVSVCDCPNVWGVGRRSWFTPDDAFFMDDHAMCGNQNAGTKRTGYAKTVCTMLTGLRILYYLGARAIYLVGVDFRMTPESGYAFAQGRDKGAAKSNNEHYSIVNDWLCQMAVGGVFERFGLSVYNCNQNSGLRAFGYIPFENAIRHMQCELGDMPFDLSGWYEK